MTVVCIGEYIVIIPLNQSTLYSYQRTKAMHGLEMVEDRNKDEGKLKELSPPLSVSQQKVMLDSVRCHVLLCPLQSWHLSHIFCYSGGPEEELKGLAYVYMTDRIWQGGYTHITCLKSLKLLIFWHIASLSETEGMVTFVRQCVRMMNVRLFHTPASLSSIH